MTSRQATTLPRSLQISPDAGASETDRKLGTNGVTAHCVSLGEARAVYGHPVVQGAEANFM
ncbi:MAG: hypothetical protein NVS4B8_29180 [Herpetosiphon sp.]